MWNCASRQRHDRGGLRYPSDLTDAQGALIAPMIPPARRGGRPRSVDLRGVVEGLRYLLETGCQWRSPLSSDQWRTLARLPKDFPPRSTVRAYFDLWSYDGTLARIHEALYMALREAEGREASPSAAIIDSQTVKSAEKGGLPGGNRRSLSSGRRSRTRGTPVRRPRVSSAICWSTPSA